MKIVNVAKAVVVDSDGQVLLLKRGDTAPTRPGDWDFPGGGVEDGETFEAAVIREIMEEISVEADNPETVYLATEYEGSRDQTVNRALYIVHLDAAEARAVTISHEHTEYKWVSVDQALQDFKHPFYGAGLAYAREHGLLVQ